MHSDDKKMLGRVLSVILALVLLVSYTLSVKIDRVAAEPQDMLLAAMGVGSRGEVPASAAKEPENKVPEAESESEAEPEDAASEDGTEPEGPSEPGTAEIFAALTFSSDDERCTSSGDVMRSCDIKCFESVLLAAAALDGVKKAHAITVEKPMTVETADSKEYAFAEGDSLNAGAAAALLILTDDTELRRLLARQIASTDAELVEAENSFAKKLKLTNTKIFDDDGENRSYTNTYDVYRLILSLCGREGFAEAFAQKGLEIALTDAEGVEKTITIPWDGSEVLKGLDGYSLYLRKNEGTRKNGVNSLTLFCDADGELCACVISDYDERARIGTVSDNLIRIFGGLDADLYTELPDLVYEKIPDKAVVPTESNDARYRYILGTDYQAFTMNNAPKGYTSPAQASKNMVIIKVPCWKMDGNGNRYSSTYSFKINKKLAETVKAIFADIYELDIKFPIKEILGYTYRKVGGVGLINCPFMSIHTFGCAIDINPGDYDNDYYLGKGNDLRDKTNPYCIPDEVIEIFEKYGWFWGGNFDICADTMHFQYFELGFLQYQEAEPFPILEAGADNTESYVENLSERLAELEYLDGPRKVFDETLKKAVTEFQTDCGLEADGIVNYETWEKLINLTHYMPFVF
ncbi:MAG: M15 family metallopeptidase [Lachnospiraceae bacterium]|nr:M15 family metallopeptidase [Lachnospiraceae bacterium]